MLDSEFSDWQQVHVTTTNSPVVIERTDMSAHAHHRRLHRNQPFNKPAHSYNDIILNIISNVDSQLDYGTHKVNIEHVYLMHIISYSYTINTFRELDGFE